jgi:colanic acid/amylovoran biosynthesis protein
MSVGAGPLEVPIHQRLVIVALRLADYASVRDASSAELLKRIGLKRAVLVRPDMGWSWSRLPEAVPEVSGITPQRIGINVMSLNDPRYERGMSITEPDWDRFDTYVGKLREVVKQLTAGGHVVVLFSTETHHDVIVRSELMTRMREDGVLGLERLELQEDTSVEGLLETIRSCDAIVATRFHAALVSLAWGRPTIALAYHSKTRDLFERLGIDTLCLDAETFTSEELLERIAAVNAIWDAARDGVAVGVEQLRAEIDEQFDRVVAL